MENENILTLDRTEPAAEQAPAQGVTVPTSEASSEAGGTPTLPGLYPLDWGTTTVRLDGGLAFKLNRPTTDLILARESELQREIPLAKDGSFATPDPTLNEDVDAKYCAQLEVEAIGYKDRDAIPAQHRAAAFQGLYVREIYVDEDFSIGDDEITVLEEFGTGDEPDFTIAHVLRAPKESELKAYRRKSSGGSIKPGRRGKQIFVTSSNLRTAMSCYAGWLTTIMGATVGGKTFDEETRAEFVACVDPLIQRRVVEAVVDAYTVKLSD